MKENQTPSMKTLFIHAKTDEVSPLRSRNINYQFPVHEVDKVLAFLKENGNCSSL